MAYLVGSMNIQVYTDSSQTNFPQQVVLNETPSWNDNSVTGVQPTIISLAASGSQTINLNGLTGVTGFYIYSSTANVNVNLNSLGNVLYKYGVPGFVPATVTSMVITNTSSTMATTVTVALIQGT
jgi:hypothetical protein